MSEQSKLNEFVRQARKENEERKVAAQEKKGNSPFWTLEQGLNKAQLQPEIPVERESSFGKMQYVFKVVDSVDGKLKDWTVTVNSPLAQKVITLLLKAPIEITVNRLGTGKATRIDLIEK